MIPPAWGNNEDATCGVPISFSKNILKNMTMAI